MLVLPLVLSGSLAAAAAAAVVLVDVEFARREAAVITSPSQAINRLAKAGRQPVALSTATLNQVAVVEVVGVGEVTVVYRDRDGNVLFLTDPARNVTVVAKNVALPEVTVREKQRDEVKRLPAKPPQTGREDGPAMAGCDSTVGNVPLTKHSSLLGACLATTAAPTRHAGLH